MKSYSAYSDDSNSSVGENSSKVLAGVTAGVIAGVTGVLAAESVVAGIVAEDEEGVALPPYSIFRFLTLPFFFSYATFALASASVSR